MPRHLAILTLLALAACGADAAPSTQPSTAPTPQTSAATTAVAATTVDSVRPFGALPDLAVVSTDGRVAVVRAGLFADPVAGLVGADGETLISTIASADRSSTTVTWSALADGATQDQTVLNGELTAIATDATAQVVALTGAGRSGTEIVVAGRHGELFRKSYDTELLPEGFSDSYGESAELPMFLFVIEYLDPRPTEATAPRRYRVRVLDTASGELGLPVNLREKTQTVDEAMLGFGRTHVLSPANGLLFTLYRGLDDDELGYAFVHTLGFADGVWCLDLPLELELGTLPGAIALADNERILVVASANGFMTEFVVDDIANGPSEPRPSRTASAWTPKGGSTVPDVDAPALAATGSQLLVGQGGDLRWVDADTMTVTSELSWDMSIEAVSLLPDGTALAAGTRRISAITPSGDLVGEMALPEGFGTVARIVVLDQK